MNIDKKVFIDGLKELLRKEVFAVSQAVVPVRTGRLKASGREFIEDETHVISYGNEQVKYAITVEKGNATEIKIRVPSYVKKDGTRVKSYMLTLKPRAGKYFAKNSIERVLDEQLDDIIISVLRKQPTVLSANK